MFSESAAWYDRFYGTKDYAGEAQLVSALIRRHQPRARTLLDVACGTGRHLEHLRREFDCQASTWTPGCSRWRLNACQGRG